MTSQVMNKIEKKSKDLNFHESMNYKHQGTMSVNYESLIVKCDKYSDFYFLVHKNMIYNNHSLVDSEYEVLSFNKSGDYVAKEDVSELGRGFFREMQVIKKIK